MLISTAHFSVQRGGTTVLRDLHLTVAPGQVLALTGASGSGKTSLLEALAGRLHHSGSLQQANGLRTAFVPQQHRFQNLSHTDTFYYQQRFNATEADDAATVEASLPQLFASAVPAYVQDLKDLFGMDALRHRRLLHLSNGENKRMQLVRALLDKPHMLLLDGPFTGLDTASREGLEKCLQQLAAGGLAILFSCTASRMPAWVHQVLVLDGKGGARSYLRNDYAVELNLIHPALDAALLHTLMPPMPVPSFTYAVRMADVCVRYGNKQVLNHVHWQVRRGEQWSLSGPNGAGKSTLLSLVTADNPQAYANEIYLFDKRRGSGESIWDIKRQIGFVSPELQLYFDRSASVFDTVASGYFDTIGLFRQLSGAQSQAVQHWLQLLHLSSFARKLLWQLPLGAQRLVLLARALIKNPPLLVLDEPMQGLDEQQGATFKHIIDAICSHNNQTLIFVSHYPDDLPQAVTHHLRLEAGKVISDV